MIEKCSVRGYRAFLNDTLNVTLKFWHLSRTFMQSDFMSEPENNQSNPIQISELLRKNPSADDLVSKKTRVQSSSRNQRTTTVTSEVQHFKCISKLARNCSEPHRPFCVQPPFPVENTTKDVFRCIGELITALGAVYFFIKAVRGIFRQPASVFSRTAVWEKQTSTNIRIHKTHS